MKNYLLVDEITKFNGTDQTRALNDLKGCTDTFLELNAVHPCEVRLFYSVRDDKTLSYEHYYIYLKGSNTRIILSKGQYHFFNQNIHTFHRLDNSEITQLSETLEKPKYIGVGKLTAKKVNDWFKYGTFLEVLCAEKQAEHENNEIEFRKTLEGQNVNYWSDKNRGSIERNGLTYEFEISRNSISTRIKLTAYKSDLESFLQLSDNKFIK